MFFPLEFPPGVYKNGTGYQARGRYSDANLARWFDGTLRPIGGWRARSEEIVSGKARCALTWADNDGTARIAVGTHTNLYFMTRSGAVSDITPAAYTAGRPSAIFGGGYGAAKYGTATYGVPRPDTTNILDATVWTLDTWGENLVGVASDDEVICEWALDTGTPAAPITGAPTAKAIVVTTERILMALGAEGNPRRLKWCDREDNTDWTPTADNTAGFFDLQTAGRLMCGKRVKGGTLLLTDIDVHVAQYVDSSVGYGFERIGTGCGIISRQAVAVIDSRAVWMGSNGFWDFNGYVQPLESDVSDYVFSHLNRSQASKVYAVHNSAFGEVWWFYPDEASTEINRYVLYNYREGHWSVGALVRLCGTDAGVLNFPIMVGDDGVVYEHEVGNTYDGEEWYAETGPLEIGDGERVVHVRAFIPDEKTLGDVQVTFKTRLHPMGAETERGPYTLSARTNVRFTGRQVSVRYEGVRNTDARIGSMRLEGEPGGLR